MPSNYGCTGKPSALVSVSASHVPAGCYVTKATNPELSGQKPNVDPVACFWIIKRCKLSRAMYMYMRQIQRYCVLKPGPEVVQCAEQVVNLKLGMFTQLVRARREVPGTCRHDDMLYPVQYHVGLRLYVRMRGMDSQLTHMTAEIEDFDLFLGFPAEYLAQSSHTKFSSPWGACTPKVPPIPRACWSIILLPYRRESCLLLLCPKHLVRVCYDVANIGCSMIRRKGYELFGSTLQAQRAFLVQDHCR